MILPSLTVGLLTCDPRIHTKNTREPSGVDRRVNRISTCQKPERKGGQLWLNQPLLKTTRSMVLPSLTVGLLTRDPRNHTKSTREPAGVDLVRRVNRLVIPNCKKL